MPVTARLSRKFYEKLGEDIAQEFVKCDGTRAKDYVANT